jgi:hypothetical protein
MLGLSANQIWRFAEVQPDIVVGFVSNAKPGAMTQSGSEHRGLRGGGRVFQVVSRHRGHCTAMGAKI